MKNNQKGFVSFLVVIIIVLLVVGGGVYFYLNKRYASSPDANVPEVVKIIPTNTTDNVVESNSSPNTNIVTDNDLWSVLDKNTLALKNKDVVAFNATSYIQVAPAEESQFSQLASFLYGEMIKINKSDYVNKWQDDKQAIFSTNPAKADNDNFYRYTQGSIMFIKKDGLWKLLSESPAKGFSILKGGTNKTSIQIEQDLQAMMLDSDKDGLTNEEETCTGTKQYDSKCIKTNPNKRDTKGNGWWDGIEKEMSK